MLKINKTITIVACSLVSGLTAHAEYEELQADYLLLTREMLPKPSELVEGCLHNLNFDPESLESLQKRQRLSYYLPQLSLGVEVQEDRIADFEFVENAQVNDMNPAQTFDDFVQTGFDDTTALDATLRWDLRDFVYDIDQQTLINSLITEENERHFLYSEVSRRYGILYSMLPEKSGQKLSKQRITRIIESAAVLDVMSGFMVSKAVLSNADENLKPVKVSKVATNVKNLADNRKEDKSAKKEPTLIQVDDGQDDSVEKAF